MLQQQHPARLPPTQLLPPCVSADSTSTQSDNASSHTTETPPPPPPPPPPTTTYTNPKSTTPKGVSPDTPETPPLHVAVVQFDVIGCRHHLERAKNPNVLDADGNTPLHVLMSVFDRMPLAATAIGNILISNGADCNAVNNDGWCPVHLAARRGQEENKSVNDILRARTGDIWLNLRSFGLSSSSSSTLQAKGIAYIVRNFTQALFDCRRGRCRHTAVLETTHAHQQEESQLIPPQPGPESCRRHGHAVFIPPVPLESLHQPQQHFFGSSSSHSAPRRWCPRTFDISKPGGSHGWTPLHLAGHACQITVLQLLISAGANVIARNVSGKTARQVSRGNIVTSKLLKAGELQWLNLQTRSYSSRPILNERDLRDTAQPTGRPFCADRLLAGRYKPSGPPDDAVHLVSILGTPQKPHTADTDPSTAVILRNEVATLTLHRGRKNVMFSDSLAFDCSNDKTLLGIHIGVVSSILRPIVSPSHKPIRTLCANMLVDSAPSSVPVYQRLRTFDKPAPQIFASKGGNTTFSHNHLRGTSAPPKPPPPPVKLMSSGSSFLNERQLAARSLSEDLAPSSDPLHDVMEFSVAEKIAVPPELIPQCAEQDLGRSKTDTVPSHYAPSRNPASQHHTQTDVYGRSTATLLRLLDAIDSTPPSPLEREMLLDKLSIRPLLDQHTPLFWPQNLRPPSFIQARARVASALASLCSLQTFSTLRAHAHGMETFRLRAPPFTTRTFSYPSPASSSIAFQLQALCFALICGFEDVVRIIFASFGTGRENPPVVGTTHPLGITGTQETLLHLLCQFTTIPTPERPNSTRMTCSSRQWLDEEVIRINLFHFMAQTLWADWDVNAVNCHGFTPLHEAARSGSAQLIKCLLLNGATPNTAETTSGWTPLHFTVARQHYSATLQLLLHPSIDPDARDFFGTTPLTDALSRMDLRAITLLVNRGATLPAPQHFLSLPPRIQSDSDKVFDILDAVIQSAEGLTTNISDTSTNAMQALLHTLRYNGFISSMEWTSKHLHKDIRLPLLNYSPPVAYASKDPDSPSTSAPPLLRLALGGHPAFHRLALSAAPPSLLYPFSPCVPMTSDGTSSPPTTNGHQPFAVPPQVAAQLGCYLCLDRARREAGVQDLWAFLLAHQSTSSSTLLTACNICSLPVCPLCRTTNTSVLHESTSLATLPRLYLTPLSREQLQDISTYASEQHLRPLAPSNRGTYSSFAQTQKTQQTTEGIGNNNECIPSFSAQGEPTSTPATQNALLDAVVSQYDEKPPKLFPTHQGSEDNNAVFQRTVSTAALSTRPATHRDPPTISSGQNVPQISASENSAPSSENPLLPTTTITGVSTAHTEETQWKSQNTSGSLLLQVTNSPFASRLLTLLATPHHSSPGAYIRTSSFSLIHAPLLCKNSLAWAKHPRRAPPLLRLSCASSPIVHTAERLALPKHRHNVNLQQLSVAAATSSYPKPQKVTLCLACYNCLVLAEF